jgi:hypothetical protein
MNLEPASEQVAAALALPQVPVVAAEVPKQPEPVVAKLPG